MTVTARRLFKQAATVPVDGGFAVVLDGRPVRTPKGGPLFAPTAGLAEALAAEWNGLGATIDPFALPLTRLANTAIDGVLAHREAVIDDLRRFAETDLVCYRAEANDGLANRQHAAWDPLIAWVGAAFGAELAVTAGIGPIPQGHAAIAALLAPVGHLDAFGLTAFHVMVGLLGSLVIGLAAACGRLDDDAAWIAASLDEIWQNEHWGADPEAVDRARARRAEFGQALLLLRLVGGDAILTRR